MLLCKSIAPRYGVSPKTIRDIWRGRTWLHATDHLWPGDEKWQRESKTSQKASRDAKPKLPAAESECTKQHLHESSALRALAHHHSSISPIDPGPIPYETTNLRWQDSIMHCTALQRRAALPSSLIPMHGLSRVSPAILSAAVASSSAFARSLSAQVASRTMQAAPLLGPPWLVPAAWPSESARDASYPPLLAIDPATLRLLSAAAAAASGLTFAPCGPAALWAAGTAGGAAAAVSAARPAATAAYGAQWPMGPGGFLGRLGP